MPVAPRTRTSHASDKLGVAAGALAVTLVCSAAAVAGASCGGGASDDGVAVDAGRTVDAADGASPVTGPTLLSQTGLYSDLASRTLAPGLIAFRPRHEFWVDGATKSRWLLLPPGTRIDTSSMDDWVFPVGTKAWKELAVGGRVVETRLLEKVAEGRGADGWWMASYVWNADGSDAIARTEGVVDALGTPHDVPSQVDCINCHQNVRDVLLGVSAIQLSGVAPPGAGGDDAGAGDASTDDSAADAGTNTSEGGVRSMLLELAGSGRLSDPPAADFAIPGSGVVRDALVYLHANCGNCHNDRAVRLATQTRMRLRLLVGQTAPESTGAFTTTVGTVMKHPVDGATDVVVPGSPETSGLWLRMGHRDAYAMPPAGTETVDVVGRETIRQWIYALPR